MLIGKQQRAAGAVADPDVVADWSAISGRNLYKAPKQRSSSLPHLADRIFNKPLLITRQKGDIILALLGARLGLAADAIPPMPVLVQMPTDDEEGCYSVQNGIACIPIHGTLVKRASGMSALSGMTSYEELTAQIQSALDNPDVKGILFDVDSPGGEADGMFDLADFMYSSRGQKPMYAVSNDSMYSAAYAIGSCADQVYVTRTGGVGSVGCYMMHIDQSGMDKQRGLKFTYVYAGDRKVDGNPHQPLNKDALAEMQDEVNRIRDMFVTLVARNRGCTAQQIIDTQAGCSYAQAALPLLADKLGGCDTALLDLMNRLGIDPAADDVDPPDDGDEGDDTLLRGIPDAGQIGGLIGGRNGLKGFEPLSSPHATAIPPHKTATSDKPWDGPANETRLKLNQPAAYYKSAFAWYDQKADLTKKSSFRYIHHEISAGGDVGAANIQACRSGIGVLNGARGGTTIPAADRQGVYAHLKKHLSDAGIDAPPLKSSNELLREAYEASARAELPALVLASKEVGWADLEFDEAYRLETFGQKEPVIFAIRTAQGMVAEASGDNRKISMLVAPYDGNLSVNLGGFREEYQAGCFRDGLTEDIRACSNHDYERILGRVSAGTARFWEDAQGVHGEADAPETTWANDLLVSMRRGDITGSSSAFFILKFRWEMRNGEKVRIVEKALLHEASVVAFPAYETTSASVAPAPMTEVVPHTSELDEARLQLLKLF